VRCSDTSSEMNYKAEKQQKEEYIQQRFLNYKCSECSKIRSFINWRFTLDICFMILVSLSIACRNCSEFPNHLNFRKPYSNPCDGDNIDEQIEIYVHAVMNKCRNGTMDSHNIY